MYTILCVQNAGLTVQFELVMPCASSASDVFQPLLVPVFVVALDAQSSATLCGVAPRHHPPPWKISSHLSAPAPTPARK